MRPSVREYYDALLEERDRRYDERIEAAKDALREAKVELESRLDLLNELRGNVIAREEYDTKHKALSDRLEKMERWQANLVGRITAFALIGSLAVAAVTTALVRHIG